MNTDVDTEDDVSLLNPAPMYLHESSTYITMNITVLNVIRLWTQLQQTMTARM